MRVADCGIWSGVVRESIRQKVWRFAAGVRARRRLLDARPRRNMRGLPYREEGPGFRMLLDIFDRAYEKHHSLRGPNFKQPPNRTKHITHMYMFGEVARGMCARDLRQMAR